MARVVRKFNSFEEAERAEFEYLSSLTPQQRLDAMLEFVYWATRDAPQILQRLCRFGRVRSMSYSQGSLRPNRHIHLHLRCVVRRRMEREKSGPLGRSSRLFPSKHHLIANKDSIGRDKALLDNENPSNVREKL